MTATPPAEPVVVHFDSRLEVTIDAPRERVWESFMNEISDWWPDDFFYAPEPRKFVIEPAAGGRIYEQSDNGFQLLWGTVLAIDPGTALNWHSVFSPPYAGPASSYIHITLEDKGDGSTLFTLTQHYMGAPSKNAQADLEEGWKLIFVDAFKPYAER